jgi:putative ABC transport system permease protein
MRWIRLVCGRIYGLFFKGRVEREMEEELRFHMRMRAALNAQAGMPPDQARLAAARRFGNLGAIKDYCRDIKGGGLVETFLADLRYGARMLMKSPVFTAVAVLTLALGVGANSAIFSAVDGMLLRPLPFDEPDRLAIVRTNYHGALTRVTSWKDLEDWRQQNGVFEQMAAYTYGGITLTGIGEPARIPNAATGQGFFEVFRISPILGRLFSPEDFTPNSPQVAVLGQGFWNQEFGADPAIIGRTLVLNGKDTTVIGVVPDRFTAIMGQVSIWGPFGRPEEDRGQRYLRIVGRLRPGVAVAQASTEIEGIAARLQQSYPDSNDGWGATALSLQDSIIGDTRLMLLVLLGVVGLVLLIACANVANLLLARAAGRSHEVAIRSAVGANRARLVRQLLTEGMLLSILGGAAALPLAFAGVKLLVKLAPKDIPRLDEVRLDSSMMVFTILLSLVTTLIFGLAPALRISEIGSAAALKDAARGTRGARHAKLRNMLVVAEVAMSLLLMVGSGLLIRSFYRLRSVNPGFNPDRLIKAEVSLPESRYKTPETWRKFSDGLLADLGSVAGSSSTAVAMTLPLNASSYSSWNWLGHEGQPYTQATNTASQYRPISNDYFRAMQIPLLEGREFNQFDTKDSTPVVILTQSMARSLFPDEDAVGKRVLFGPKRPVEIIGVVGDVKRATLDIPDDMASYVPFNQNPAPSFDIVARSQSNPSSLAAAFSDAVHKIDKDLPVSRIATMDDALDTTLAERRFYLLLMCGFAGLAVLLAAVGTYGVISYSVAERTHEVGIRMALGATRGTVVSLVVRQALVVGVIGVAIGLAGAYALTRVLKTLLFEVSPTDPITFALVALLLILVSVLASYAPARRATRVDPILALRYE